MVWYYGLILLALLVSNRWWICGEKGNHFVLTLPEFCLYIFTIVSVFVLCRSVDLCTLVSVQDGGGIRDETCGHCCSNRWSNRWRCAISYKMSCLKRFELQVWWSADILLCSFWKKGQVQFWSYAQIVHSFLNCVDDNMWKVVFSVLGSEIKAVFLLMIAEFSVLKFPVLLDYWRLVFFSILMVLLGCLFYVLIAINSLVFLCFSLSMLLMLKRGMGF